MKNINWKRICVDVLLLFIPELMRLVNNWVDKKKEEKE